ncbi:hypothetical protein EUGRSUZ_A01545 [Eucalyptus grandis]|uniref:Uncharacterized protein n=2 Tax=Eucalyptus grandis TaxID=71139 RepID=A0ACC3M3T3_EUCGR|nr:hypothetical protein EUGRSUZ_A01545 [Eucalyptus grandis]
MGKKVKYAPRYPPPASKMGARGGLKPPYVSVATPPMAEMRGETLSKIYIYIYIYEGWGEINTLFIS